MLGVAFQAASQAPKQALTFDHTDRLHMNQDREVIEGGVRLQSQANNCCLEFHLEVSKLQAQKEGAAIQCSQQRKWSRPCKQGFSCLTQFFHT